MNVQLDTVPSDIMGMTGQRIGRAIVDGERDGAVLARHRDRRVKADQATIARSLRGNWREEQLFSLSQALERHDFLQAQLHACEQGIASTLQTPDGAHEFAEKPLAVPPRNAGERTRCGNRVGARLRDRPRICRALPIASISARG